LGHDNRQAGRLPGLDAAADVGRVLVAEITEQVGRARRAAPGGAVEDHPLGTVGDELLDSLSDLDRAAEPAPVAVGLLVLVVLAGVEQGDVARCDLLLSLGRIDLLDPRLDFLYRFSLGRHQVVSPSMPSPSSASSAPTTMSPSTG